MKNIMEKMLLIRQDLDGFVYDSKSHTGQYAGGSQVLHKFRESANEHGVMLIQSTKNHTLELNQTIYKDTKKGYEKTTNHFVVNGIIEYTYFDIDSGESLIVSQPLIGSQTDPSQAIGSALTYAERYQISKQFSVPTDKDDPDARKKQEIQEEQCPAKMTTGCIIPTVKGEANEWTWNNAPGEYLQEISSTHENPKMVDMADKVLHDRNLKEMSDKVVKIIHGGVEAHDDTFRQYLQDSGYGNINKIKRMKPKELSEAHVKILAKIQELNRSK